MIARCAVLLLLAVTAAGEADTIVPTAPGTTWKYHMTQEFGRGVRPTDIKPDPDGKVRLPVTIVVTGSEKIDDVEVHKFETRRQDSVQVIQFLQVTEQGMFEVARGDGSGERIQLTPAQKLLSFPLKAGEKWEYRGEGGGEKVDETYEIVARESIEVPAGRFNAYHLRVIGREPFPSVVDRWYVPGLGEIKDITEVRRSDGSMVQRLSFELVERPNFAGSAEPRPGNEAKKLSVTLGKAPAGGAITQCRADTPKLYARWQGHGFPGQSRVGVVWIAENVGEAAPANHKVNESSVVASSGNPSGTFTLSRPAKGWPTGDYRVELYLDEILAETIRLKIVK